MFWKCCFSYYSHVFSTSKFSFWLFATAKLLSNNFYWNINFWKKILQRNFQEIGHVFCAGGIFRGKLLHISFILIITKLRHRFFFDRGEETPIQPSRMLGTQTLLWPPWSCQGLSATNSKPATGDLKSQSPNGRKISQIAIVGSSNRRSKLPNLWLEPPFKSPLESQRKFPAQQVSTMSFSQMGHAISNR